MKKRNTILLLALAISFFLISGCLPLDKDTKICTKQGTEDWLSLAEAKEIALSSECTIEGNIMEEAFCNENTGTWWIELDLEREGCNPACVVNVETKEAEINWRCTGLIEE